MRRILVFLLALFGAVAGARAQSATPVIEYYHLDAVGSVRAVTNEAGQVIRTHASPPFGTGDGTQAGTDTLRFSSKERDPETGLDYFGARYYGSRTGRFTTVDPALDLEAALVDPQRWNRYSYAINRPLTMIDPDGREAGYIYLPNGQMRSPIAPGAARHLGTIVGGGTAVGAAIAAGPVAWRAIVGCFLSPSCQSQAINVLESAAGGTPTQLNPARLLPALTETTRASLLEAAVEQGRGGLSAAGAALQSHASRVGSWLSGLASAGNAAKNTATAEAVLRDLLARGQVTHGTAKVSGNIINVIRIRLQDGAGAWWTEEGEFIGFLERYTPR